MLKFASDSGETDVPLKSQGLSHQDQLKTAIHWTTMYSHKPNATANYNFRLKIMTAKWSSNRRQKGGGPPGALSPIPCH